MNNIPFVLQLNNSNSNQFIQAQHIQSFKQPQLIVQQNPLLLNGINPIQIQQPFNIQTLNQSAQPFFIINLPQQNPIVNKIPAPNLIPFETNNVIPVNSINTQNNQIHTEKSSSHSSNQVNNSNDVIEIDQQADEISKEKNETEASTSKNITEPYKFVFGKYNKNKKKVENTFVNENENECEKEDNSDVLYSYVCDYCTKKKKKFASQYGLSCHLRDVHSLSREKIEEISGSVGEMIDTDNLIAHLNATALLTTKKCYTKEESSTIEENKSLEINPRQSVNNKSLYDKDNTEADEFTDFKLIDKKMKKIKKQGLTSLQKRSSHLALDEKVEEEKQVETVSPAKKVKKSNANDEEFSCKIDKNNIKTSNIRTRSKNK
jgi:hypothetical protein